MTVRKLFAFLLLLSPVAVVVQVALDPDLWWHLRSGEYVVEFGIPDHDPGFSFTAADQKWFMHEWLSDVVVYLIHQSVGLWGLSLVFAAVVAVTFALMYWTSVGRPYLAGFIAFWGLVTTAPFVNARPQMLNILFAAAFVTIVERFKDGHLSHRWLWLLPALTVAWANAHSGFLLGIAILGVYVVGSSVQLFFPGGDRRELAWPDIRYLAAVTAVSFLVSIINPNTYRLWLYPFSTTLASKAMQTYIAEWQSPDFHVWYFWIFGLMLLTALVSLSLSKTAPTVTDLLFLVGSGAAGLQSIRHIPIFSVVAIPIMCRHLLSAAEGTRLYGVLSGEKPEQPLSPMMSRFNLLFAGAAVLVASSWTVRVLSQTDEGIRAVYPVAAVDYLERTGRADARIFNDYGWGGYLIWRGIPVFIDGRADLYGDDFIFQYQKTNNVEKDWRVPLDEFEVDYVLVRGDSPLAALLTESQQWQSIYDDGLAQIFDRVAGSSAREAIPPGPVVAPLELPSGAVPSATTTATGRRPESGARAERLRVDVLGVRPHDPAAFTQGLVWHAGALYESTGQYGQSTLREVDPATGEVRRQIELPPEQFGEGLALIGDRLVQVTWREHVASVYDRRTFELIDEFGYETEGWGLCFDGEQLVMSDGSPNLYFRDPDTFEIVGRIAVTLDGVPLGRLNELECVGDVVYANVWQTDLIARVNKGTGAVEAAIDASGLLTGSEAQGADVLNGIAFDSRNNTFLITGKWWPKLFEVRFVPAE